MNVEYITHSGSDLLVVNAARCSFGKEKQEFDEKDAKLISFLAKERHVLPFRHPSVTLRCKAPIFVARQLGKHQVGMSWSEESRRYIKTEPEFYWPDKWRKAAENVKQGSSDEAHDMVWYHGTGGKNGSTDLLDWMEEVRLDVVYLYNSMLEAGVCTEQARMILPQNMYTTWVWTGTLLAWTHMLKLRLEEHTQKETRDFAQMVKEIVQPLFPCSFNALMEN